jgi:PAS domain S-box-containing protein
MLQFDFTNLAGFLIAFIPALINISLIVYILFFLPRNRLVNIFTILTVCAALWQIDDSLARISSSANMADFWDCILCAGWMLVGPLCLHFSLLYCKIIKENISFLHIGFLYFPSFIFMGFYQTHSYEHVFRWRNIWGWVNHHDKATIDIITVYWISILVITACVLLFRYSYKVRNDKLLGLQAIIIATGISVPTITGLVSQVVLPIMLKQQSIPITSSFLTFLSLATVLALKNFRLFTISELISNDILLEELPVAVISISDTGHITFINKYGSDLLEIKKNRYQKLDFNTIEKVGNLNEKKLRQSYQLALTGRIIQDVESTLVIGKKTITVLISARPIINNNKVRAALICLRDITQLKESEHSLKEKNNELRKTNANLEEYAFVASHDLREPLRKIITFSGMILTQENNTLSAKSKEYFERIVATSQRMQAMIDDLLTLSVVTKDDTWTRVNLETILKDVLSDLEILINEKDAIINYSDLPYLNVNPQQFHQLFLNLIGNSLKFSAKGRQPVINISARKIQKHNTDFIAQHDELLEITVSDNGIGFDNSYANKIFNMFQRLNGRLEFEGTGIGLAICKKIVESHHGKIDAKGVVGKGSTFTILLPAEITDSVINATN